MTVNNWGHWMKSQKWVYPKSLPSLLLHISHTCCPQDQTIHVYWVNEGRQSQPGVKRKQSREIDTKKRRKLETSHFDVNTDENTKHFKMLNEHFWPLLHYIIRWCSERCPVRSTRIHHLKRGRRGSKGTLLPENLCFPADGIRINTAWVYQKGSSMLTSWGKNKF